MFLNYYSQNSLKNTILGVLNEMFNQFIDHLLIRTTNHGENGTVIKPGENTVPRLHVSSSLLVDGFEQYLSLEATRPNGVSLRTAMISPEDYRALFDKNGIVDRKKLESHIPGYLVRYTDKPNLPFRPHPKTVENHVGALATHIEQLGPNHVDQLLRLLPPERR
jgi:hypothetical protein